MPEIESLVPDSHRDLLTSQLTATFTTVDGKGRPQSTAVWYLLDGGELLGSVTEDRQKYRNLARNPACALLVIDPANPQRTLEVRANAELTPDPDNEVVGKFAEAYGAPKEMLVAAGGARYTVTLRPWRVVANPPA